MTTQQLIGAVLDRIRPDPVLMPRAQALLDGFSLGVQEIHRRAIPPAVRTREICRRRDLLYAELLNLIDPLGLSGEHQPLPPGDPTT